MNYNYDIALSFAGEDRQYVENCAAILKSLGLNIFYDNYEKEVLLGKNLYSYLADIYQNQAKYVVIFLSENYIKKRWTKHELEFITARKFEQEEEYLLPVRIDNTNIPGIPLTTGYITATTPLETAKIIAKKLNSKFDIQDMLNELKFHLPDYKISIEGSNVVFDCRSEDFHTTYPLGFMMELYRHELIMQAFIIPSIVPN